MLIYWKGTVPPKARPRFNSNSGHAYMPKKYMQWKQDFGSLVCYGIAASYPFETPLKQADIRIVFFGRHRNADPDNLAGAILDALVDSGVIENDTLENIPSLSILWEDNKTNGCKLSITPYRQTKESQQ